MHVQISFQKNNRYTDGLDDDDDTTIQVANRQLRHIPLIYVLLRMLGTVRLLLSANVSNFNDGAVAPWLCLLQVSSSIIFFQPFHLEVEKELQKMFHV